MPQKGLPQTTMNALVAQEREQKKGTPMGEGGTPNPEFSALMTGDLESLPDSGGPMGTIPPSGSTIGPASPGWFERLRQNGFQATDEVRGMLKSAFDLYRGVLEGGADSYRAWTARGLAEGENRRSDSPDLPRFRHGEFGLDDKHETGPWPRIIR